MRALLSRQNAAVLAVLFVVGCATKPPSVKEEVSVWLSESPRAIAINVERELPSASIRTRDYRAGERVGKGAITGVAGAGLTIGYGCVGGLATGLLWFITCPVGIVAAPIVGAVGAVAGAATVKSVDQHHPIDAARGSAPLFQGVNLTALLSEAIVSQNDKARGHVLRAVRVDEEGKALPGEEALLQVRFTEFGLFGDIGEDPRVALVVGVHAGLQTPPAWANGWGEFAYEGSGRRVSEWSADEARLFRDEIAIALRAIATQFVEELRKSPSGSALSKVAAWKLSQSSAPRAEIVVPITKVAPPQAPLQQ